MLILFIIYNLLFIIIIYYYACFVNFCTYKLCSQKYSETNVQQLNYFFFFITSKIKLNNPSIEITQQCFSLV